jgi:hypothetical protein
LHYHCSINETLEIFCRFIILIHIMNKIWEAHNMSFVNSHDKWIDIPIRFNWKLS